MKKAIVILALFLVAVSCTRHKPKPATNEVAETQSTQRTALIVHLHGEVLVKRGGVPDWVKATQGMKLGANDKVRTHRESFATIKFDTGGLMRLEPDSLMAITDLLFENRSKINRSTFSLEKGRVETELQAMGGKKSALKIKTPSAVTTLTPREVAFQ